MMEKNYYSLDNTEDNRLVKIIRIIFGLICLVVVVFWIIFITRSIDTNRSIWITIIFLFAFGVYQILSGSGLVKRYIIINTNNIIIKKIALVPPSVIMSDKIEKLDFLPLNVVFNLKSQKRILLRFGTINYETNEKIVENLIGFAENNDIPFEIIEERL